MWQGLYPPQAVFSKRKFKKVLLDPPNFKPGSWCGAGKLWIDIENSEYWLTSRPREGEEKRGIAVEIYWSKDSENYILRFRMTKEEISEICGRTVQSIENQQLLQDPLTNRYFLYLSLDVTARNVAGRTNRIHESNWETYLMSSVDPSGPWKGEGFVLRCDKDYDSAEARDSTIDIIDGRYMALYKARKTGTEIVHTALALSSNGKNWVKIGTLKIDAKPPPNYFLLSGSILAGSGGPIFLGAETTDLIRGAALTKRFVAYKIDCRELNLETLFMAPWIPGSQYEHSEWPIHTYTNVVYDPIKKRWLTWIEAVDPVHSKKPGLNLEVDRVLLYITE